MTVMGLIQATATRKYWTIAHICMLATGLSNEKVKFCQCGFLHELVGSCTHDHCCPSLTCSLVYSGFHIIWVGTLQNLPRGCLGSTGASLRRPDSKIRLQLVAFPEGKSWQKLTLIGMEDSAMYDHQLPALH